MLAHKQPDNHYIKAPTCSKKAHPKEAYPLRIHIQAGGRQRQGRALQCSIRGRAFLGSTIMYVLRYQHRNWYFTIFTTTLRTSEQWSAYSLDSAQCLTVGEGNGQQIEAGQWRGYNNMQCPCLAFWDLC
jgi:hypothetical protein